MLTDHTKQANWLDTLMNAAGENGPAVRNALLGAGAGAAVTGITSATQKSPKSETSSERRRRILRNALAGGVFGGGAGYLLPKAMDVMRNAAPPNTEAADTADEWGKAFAPGTAAGGMYGRMAGAGLGYGASRWRAHGRETKFIEGQAGDFFNRLNKHFDENGPKARAAQFLGELRRRWGNLKIDGVPLTDKTMTDKVLLDKLRGSSLGGVSPQFDSQTKLLKSMTQGNRLTGSKGPWARTFTDRSAVNVIDGRPVGGLPGGMSRHGRLGGLGMVGGAFLPEIGRNVPHLGAWISDMFGAKSLSDPPTQ